MATYGVYVFCDECGEVHPMGIAIELSGGPVEKASIGDVFQGRELPENIAQLTHNTIICPKTRKPVLQRNNDQVFLVPIK
jgi:hypothetical protein